MHARTLLLALSITACAAAHTDPDAAVVPADAARDAAPSPDAPVLPDATVPVDVGHDAPAPLDAALDAFRPDAGSPSGSLAIVATYLGGISTYTVAESGALTQVTGSPFDRGGQFYSVAAEPTGHYVYATVLFAGDVVGYAIAPSGALTPLPGPALHVGDLATVLAMSPDGHSLYVGFGSLAQIAVLTIGASGALVAQAPVTTPSAVSNLTIDASGHTLYAAYQSGGIAAFARDSSTGALTPVAGSPFVPGTLFGGGLATTPSGAHLYSAQDVLHGLAIDSTHALTMLAGSPFTGDPSGDVHARTVSVTPDGRFVYASDMSGGHVLGYAIDASTGALTAVPGSPFAASAAYSVTVEPTGRYVYAPGDFGTITAFAIDAATGALTPIAGSPFAIEGLQPQMVLTRRL